jgi:hypothetical protein
VADDRQPSRCRPSELLPAHGSPFPSEDPMCTRCRSVPEWSLGAAPRSLLLVPPPLRMHFPSDARSRPLHELRATAYCPPRPSETRGCPVVGADVVPGKYP